MVRFHPDHKTLNKNNMNKYTITSRIQYKDGDSYKLLAEYPFLYIPLENTKIKRMEMDYELINSFDIINEEGNLIRYFQYE